MRRKLFVTLLTSAALSCAHAQAGGTQNDMPPQNTQQEQHVIASPNPTIDDSKSTVEPGKITATRIQPAVSATAAPMKKATRPKRKRKSRQ